MTASPERNYYTMSEAAVRLGMSSKQVSEMVRHGTIPGIHRVDLHAWLNRHANA